MTHLFIERIKHRVYVECDSKAFRNDISLQFKAVDNAYTHIGKVSELCSPETYLHKFSSYRKFPAHFISKNCIRWRIPFGNKSTRKTKQNGNGFNPKFELIFISFSIAFGHNKMVRPTSMEDETIVFYGFVVMGVLLSFSWRDLKKSDWWYDTEEKRIYAAVKLCPSQREINNEPLACTVWRFRLDWQIDCT